MNKDSLPQGKQLIGVAITLIMAIAILILGVRTCAKQEQINPPVSESN